MYDKLVAEDKLDRDDGCLVKEFGEPKPKEEPKKEEAPKKSEGKKKDGG